MSIRDQLGKFVNTPGTQAPSVSVAQAPSAPATQTVSAPNTPAHLDALEKSKAEATQRLSDLLTELGRAYYEDHAGSPQTEYEAQIAAIREAYAEIDRCQRQADEIASRKRCPSCGAQLPEGSLFCNMCGAKLPEAPGSTEPPAPEQRLCPKCGTVLGPDDLFCVACGADLRNIAANGGA